MTGRANLAALALIACSSGQTAAESSRDAGVEAAMTDVGGGGDARLPLDDCASSGHRACIVADGDVSWLLEVEAPPDLVACKLKSEKGTDYVYANAGWPTKGVDVHLYLKDSTLGVGERWSAPPGFPVAGRFQTRLFHEEDGTVYFFADDGESSICSLVISKLTDGAELVGAELAFHYACDVGNPLRGRTFVKAQFHCIIEEG